MEEMDYIDDVVALKNGSKELALFRWEDGSWTAMIGNEMGMLTLGEVSPDFEAEGASLLEALKKLEDMIIAERQCHDE